MPTVFADMPKKSRAAVASVRRAKAVLRRALVRRVKVVRVLMALRVKAARVPMVRVRKDFAKVARVPMALRAKAVRVLMVRRVKVVRVLMVRVRKVRREPGVQVGPERPFMGCTKNCISFGSRSRPCRVRSRK